MKDTKSAKTVNPLERFPLNMQQALRLLAAVALRRHAQLQQEKRERQEATAKRMTE